MRCVLTAGCCLVLAHISVCLQLQQKPRFIGVKSGKNVRLWCFVEKSGTVIRGPIHWFRAVVYNGEKHPLVQTEGIEVFHGNSSTSVQSNLRIKNVMPEHSGIYFCNANDTWGLGSELKVLRHILLKDAMKKSQTKDAFIVLQALLLTACALIPVVLYMRKVAREDRIYEEPEDNHLYEGLQIEHCDLYEDIPAYSQPAEAPWEGPESPCEE
ncbi:B-cell antigen receptor complex-associated protein beta chain [Scleropages formosus]|nr:B-cell antigen receptor complex-associated protein beta chain [Scleropages formosus]